MSVLVLLSLAEEGSEVSSSVADKSAENSTSDGESRIDGSHILFDKGHRGSCLFFASLLQCVRIIVGLAPIVSSGDEPCLSSARRSRFAIW